MQQTHVKQAIDLFAQITDGFAKEGITPRYAEELHASRTYSASLISKNDGHDFQWSIAHTDETSVVSMRLRRPGVYFAECISDLARGQTTLIQQEEGESRSVGEMPLPSGSEVRALIMSFALIHQKAQETEAAMAAAAV